MVMSLSVVLREKSSPGSTAGPSTVNPYVQDAFAWCRRFGGGRIVDDFGRVKQNEVGKVPGPYHSSPIETKH